MRGVLAIGLWLAACSGTPTPSAKEDPEAPGPRAARKARAGKAAKGEVAPKPPLDEGLKRAPNILLIVWDTVRADHTSIYGYDKPTTPKVAEKAKDAKVYDRAVSPGVWTLPSHASMFTGLPERGHGVNADYNWLDSSHETVAESLGAAGYDTYTFCANPYLANDTNLLQGFDVTEFPWTPRWRKGVDAHMKSKLIPEDASTPVSPAYKGKGGADSNRYLFKEAGPVLGEALFTWIDQRPEKDRPFFAFVNYMEAHLPRIPSLAARKAVMTDAEIDRSYQVVQSTTDFHAWMVGAKTYDDADLAAIRGVYDASLVDLDAATAALLDELDRRGLAEDTIVILTSDHGEHLGDHDLLLHKYAVYNSLTRVPLLVWWKGKLAPGRDAAPKTVADALIDALEMGEVPLSAARLAQLRGRPGRVEGEAVAQFSAVADGSVTRMKKLYPQLSTARLERTFDAYEAGPWKYIVGSDGREELYSMVEDPHEVRDRAAQEAAVAAELRGKLEAWKQAVPVYKATGEYAGHKRSDELQQGLEAMGYVE